MTQQHSLQGRVVAVTGASKGIGLALVRALAAQGAAVLGGARDVSGLQETGVTFQALDVSDPASVAAFASACREAGVDALVNNAGVGTFKPVQDITPEDYRRVMDTNVLGTILTTGALVAHFQARYGAGQGSQVVNVTSDVSGRTFAGGALYTASKFAQRAVTHALAYEGQAYGLRVTEIRPGMVDTYFGDTQQGEAHKAAWLRPEDVADAVVYALTAPAHVRIDEVLLHPTVQEVAYP
ncbi:SDR family NAD(P)-dependent oxidoreductase [Deinococcus sp. HMF7620]|uniref:SDR family NAD(P)-dependent oxidoreductase n=1 Tax=Deinococcus arboris TaxID=2682977 RepID=A0A7C9LKF6_9DEIO|nr:SDR family oxidoreductase [Deinococcus arboris]MVN86618.1 SDR family NAD(P)-dependent oxidoreductase [Deinococcus arboris]